MKETQDKVQKILGVCVDGLPFFFAFLTVTIILFVWKGIWISSPLIILSLWCLWFFRDPDRKPENATQNSIVSPADGKIIRIQEVQHPYLLSGTALRVSVFMSVFNVHVNRIPLTGTIQDLEYHKGKFFGAYDDKASIENEQMGIVLKSGMHTIMFVQIAGLIARRIICRLNKGESVVQGQRFGLIRFGSRVDLYLPPQTRLSVKLGDKVLSGQSILGEL